MNDTPGEFPLGVECAWPMFLEPPLARVIPSRAEAEEVVRRLLKRVQANKPSSQAK